MPDVIAYYEVADGSKWLSSSSRADLLASLGIKARTFVDAENPHRMAAFLELPNLEVVIETMKNQSVIASMILQGVNMETYSFFLER